MSDRSRYQRPSESAADRRAARASSGRPRRWSIIAATESVQVVSHAGSGTFLAALAAQLPQVCIPQAADQFFNAAACAQVGAGIALAPDGVSVEAVDQAVAKLLSEAAYREAARRVSGEIAAMPSPTEVAEKLHATYG